GCHGRPSNRTFSLPVRANRQHRSAWVLRNTLTQKPLACPIANHVSLSFIAKKPTSGGSSEIEVNEPTVKPIGRPAASPVTIVTPLGQWPRTALQGPRPNAADGGSGHPLGSLDIGGHGRRAAWSNAVPSVR